MSPQCPQIQSALCEHAAHPEQSAVKIAANEPRLLLSVLCSLQTVDATDMQLIKAIASQARFIETIACMLKC